MFELKWITCVRPVWDLFESVSRAAEETKTGNDKHRGKCLSETVSEPLMFIFSSIFFTLLLSVLLTSFASCFPHVCCVLILSGTDSDLDLSVFFLFFFLLVRLLCLEGVVAKSWYHRDISWSNRFVVSYSDFSFKLKNIQWKIDYRNSNELVKYFA